jgi:hypothetical protein
MSIVLSSVNQLNIDKYTAHKNWNFTSSSFSANNISYLRGQYSNKPVVISASSAIGEIQNPDGSYIKNTYYNLNHLYYNTYDLFGYIKYPEKSFIRTLNKECIVYSIPQSYIGNSIKKNSFNFTVIGPNGETNTIRDNGNYELIDTSINTSSFVNSPILYYGFNNEFNESYKPNYINNNVTFSTGIQSTYYSYGYSAYFNGTSSIQVEDNGKAWSDYFTNDFCVSFWMNISSSITSAEHLTLISKKWNGTLLETYPFHITYDTVHRTIRFNYANSYQVKIIESTVPEHPLSDRWCHVVCQKSGSQLQIYLDSATDSGDTILNDISISNNSQIYIGATNLNNLNGFIGSIDEVRFFNRALTVTEIGYLSTITNTDYSAMQTNKVGNIFYENGLVVYSPLQNEYVPTIYNVQNTYFSYKSSLNITQQKCSINIPMDHFNISNNQSLYENSKLKSFTTGSDFTPYITTIGLYDTSYNLIAVAKLGTPLAKRNDIDLNIEIKFDIS